MKINNKERLEKLNPQMIPLGYLDADNNPAVWNLGNGQTALETPTGFDKTRTFETMVAHIQKFPGRMEWCAYDIPGNMFADKSLHDDHVARDLVRAWQMSLFLGKEIAERLLNKKTGIPVVVIINDGNSLFKIRDPKHLDIYMEMLDCFHSIVTLGPKAGVYVLLQSTSETREYPELQSLQIKKAS